MDKDARVCAEVKRLNTICADLPENDRKVMDGLIVQAARLRVSLDDLWSDICDNGETEVFQQSDKVPPYDRERPAAHIFNARDKNFQTVIKQIVDRLPRKADKSAADELEEFLQDRKK